MLSEYDVAFLAHCRVGHLATADRESVPQLVPVCFAVDGASLYTPIDEKPKSGRALKRLANIRANPRVAFLADRYDEDWSRLGWLRIDGTAEILNAGAEFERAAQRLAQRYPQYRRMTFACIVAIRMTGTRAWGNLAS